MTATTTPKRESKTAILAAERKARREAREAKKIFDAERLAAARIKAASLSKAMPADYPGWGVVRTRAYVQLLEIIQSKAGNVTMKPATLEQWLEELSRASTWTLPYCQHLSMLHSRAADITSPHQGAE
jgi:hypothetical protein